MATSRMAENDDNRQTNIQSASNPQAHLLGIPYEIRRQIWDIIYSSIPGTSSSAWFERPVNLWEGLELTCKQIQDEVSDLWPKSKLTATSAAEKFLEYDFLSLTSLRSLSRISLELSNDEIPDYYETVGAGLQYLESHLRELRLFFVSKPSTPLALHECFLRQDNTQQKSLLPSVSNAKAKLPVLRTIATLSRLSLLVIVNMDCCLGLDFLIAAKPYLAYVRVTADPRLTQSPLTHLPVKMNAAIMRHKVIPPPIKKLHLTANAVIRGLELFKCALEHLEEVAWTVPRKSKTWQLIDFTATLIGHLTNAPNLKTFRLCLEDPIDEELPQFGALEAAIRYRLPQFGNLRSFEFHGRHKDFKRSVFFSREIILDGLPNSVKRFYTSETLIPAKILEETVTQRYLKAPETAGSLGHIRAGGRLGFIGYTYSSKERNASEETKMTLFKLNGRLLDRERNLKKWAWKEREEASDVENCTSRESVATCLKNPVASNNSVTSSETVSTSNPDPWSSSSAITRPNSSSPPSAKTPPSPSTDATTNDWQDSCNGFPPPTFLRITLSHPLQPITPTEVDLWLLKNLNIADEPPPPPESIEGNRFAYADLQAAEAQRWIDEPSVAPRHLPPLTYPDDEVVQGGGHWMS